MPIRKFRSVMEMDRVWRVHPGTAEHSRAVRAVFWMATRFCPPHPFPPGVYKYRSIEEAQAQRKEWLRAAANRGKC